MREPSCIRQQDTSSRDSKTKRKLGAETFVICLPFMYSNLTLCSLPASISSSLLHPPYKFHLPFVTVGLRPTSRLPQSRSSHREPPPRAPRIIFHGLTHALHPPEQSFNSAGFKFYCSERKLLFPFR